MSEPNVQVQTSKAISSAILLELENGSRWIIFYSYPLERWEACKVTTRIWGDNAEKLVKSLQVN